MERPVGLVGEAEGSEQSEERRTDTLELRLHQLEHQEK